MGLVSLLHFFIGSPIKPQSNSVSFDDNIVLLVDVINEDCREQPICKVPNSEFPDDFMVCHWQFHCVSWMRNNPALIVGVIQGVETHYQFSHDMYIHHKQLIVQRSYWVRPLAADQYITLLNLRSWVMLCAAGAALSLWCLIL